MANAKANFVAARAALDAGFPNAALDGDNDVTDDLSDERCPFITFFNAFYSTESTIDPNISEDDAGNLDLAIDPNAFGCP